MVVLLALLAAPPAPAAQPGWQVVGRARTGSMPWGASVSPDGRWLYVTHVGNKDHDNVFRYDATSLAVEARADFPGHAVESIVSRDGRRLFVTNSRKGELLVLDASSLRVLDRHPAGRIPKDFRLSPDESRAYVADYGGGVLIEIELAGGKTRKVAVGRHPRGVALAADGKTVYVTNNGARTLSVVDADRLAVVRTAPVCPSPRHVAVGADGAIHVGCLGSARLVVLDPDSLEPVRRVRVGKGPKTVLATAELIVSANERDHSLTFVDPRTWASETLPLPARGPCGLALSPDGQRLYVTARGSHELLVLERR
jgi:YVTN family beta-propeller protein